MVVAATVVVLDFRQYELTFLYLHDSGLGAGKYQLCLLEGNSVNTIGGGNRFWFQPRGSDLVRFPSTVLATPQEGFFHFRSEEGTGEALCLFQELMCIAAFADIGDYNIPPPKHSHGAPGCSHGVKVVRST